MPGSRWVRLMHNSLSVIPGLTGNPVSMSGELWIPACGDVGVNRLFRHCRAPSRQSRGVGDDGADIGEIPAASAGMTELCGWRVRKGLRAQE